MTDSNLQENSPLSNPEKPDRFSGWACIHRKIFSSEWRGDPTAKLLFIAIFTMANHQKKTWKNNTIERGQLLTGRKQLAEMTGLSEQNVRSALKRLEATSQLTIKSTKKFSIITVCNYEEYQREKELANQESNHQSNQQPTTNNNNNTLKKSIIYTPSEEEPKARKKRTWKKPSPPHSLEEITEEQLNNLQLIFPKLDVRREFMKAKNWSANKGAKHKAPYEFLQNWLMTSEERLSGVKNGY